MSGLDDIDLALLNDFQRDLSLVSEPYAVMAERLGVSQSDVLDRLSRLQELGAVSRIGAVLAPGRVGASTLAAMAVPPESLESVAAIVSARSEVNHNYEREHRLNLWFVVTAATPEDVWSVLESLERETGVAILNLPLEQGYHIDLGFNLSDGEARPS